MLFQRIFHLLFRRRRRYRDARYTYTDLTAWTATPFRERLWRWFFKPAYCDSDGSAIRMARRFRLVLSWAALWGLGWFLAESLQAWDVFSGN
jgi:hypothetical protein